MATTWLVVLRMVATLIFAAGAVWLAKEGQEGWGWCIFASIVLGRIRSNTTDDTEQENMGRTLEMFEKPRKPRQWLMHVSDGGGDGPDDVWVRFQCQRCELETEWMKALTVTEAKRGIPCPTCNATHNV